MNNTPTHEEITQRARDIWEQRGRPGGQELEHWLQAERELRHEREQAERVRPGTSGPASDFVAQKRGKAGRSHDGNTRKTES